MRRRITVLASLTAALAVLLFAIPLGVAVARYLVSDERLELQRNAASVAAKVSGDLGRAQAEAGNAEPGTTISVYDATGTRVGGSGPVQAAPVVRAAVSGTAAAGSVDGRIAAAAPVSDGDTITGVVLITSSHAQVNQRIAVAWAAMLGLGLVAVGATAVMAGRYSRRLAGPLEELAVSAGRIGEPDFAASSARSGIDELDTLRAALAESSERIDRMLQRERAFSADASHQLRTPLTGMRLELESALDDPGIDLRAAVTRALTTADQVEDTIATLLSLARDQPRPAVVDAGSLLARVHLRWHGRLAALGRPLRISAVPDPASALRISPGAAEQILDVLVDNALQHGQGAITVTVRELAGTIAIDVSDEGPALSLDSTGLFAQRPADQTHHGRGLVLARILAEAEGARLHLSRNDPPTFTLLVTEQDAP
ncbi:MAG: hypothetical protein QOD87_1500 [Pseudonocardiales bacterium]|jgi:signal transduction histidine kinase|nr:hypothetical protein [Pseudonocardiales bacterium]